MNHCQITGVEMPDEKKARYEAAAQKLLEYKSSGKFQPSNEYLDEWRDCNNVWWEAIDWLADWQAKRENSPDIRADNVSEPTEAILTSQNFGQIIIGSISSENAASDSSAEFPEARKLAFEIWPANEICGHVNIHATLRQGFEVGFERGRAAAKIEIANAYHESDLLIEKLAEAQDKIEFLHEQRDLDADKFNRMSDEIMDLKAEIERLKGVCKDFNRAANSHFDQSVTNRKLYEEAQAEIERLKEKYERT